MDFKADFSVWEMLRNRVNGKTISALIRRMKFVFAILCLIFTRSQLAAGHLKTDSVQKRDRYVSAGFSAIAYKGSLQDAYSRWTPSFQLGIQLEKKKLLSSFIGIGFGSYIGEDRNYRLPAKADQNLQPAASFEGQFFTLHYEARFLLFRYRGFHLQACQGIGLFRFSVKDRNGNNLSEKPKSRSNGETYSQNSFFFPSSLMLMYRFPNRMSLGFQAGWYNNNSQYLDNMKVLSANQNRDNLASLRFHFSLPLN